jgi:hypothetical protein
MVNIEIVEEVVVNVVVVVGERIVNSPAGVPEAMRLVAVRVNVEVVVITEVHNGGCGGSVVGVGAVEEDIRHEQAEEIESESYGDSPSVSHIFSDSTVRKLNITHRRSLGRNLRIAMSSFVKASENFFHAFGLVFIRCDPCRCRNNRNVH